MELIPDYKPITSAKTSNYFTKDHFKKQIERIKMASELAQKKMDYYVAHDDNILYAIEIVEQFLRKRPCICYGGQAINAHLPSSHKIYDPQFSIPDYDFFSPSPNKDIELLVKLLQNAGFQDISMREGMHEGTIKVYVDYIPVADVTAIHPQIYKTLYRRAAVFDGIHYLDATSLRMLMYLELSRPRGEVARWSKVFERLMIFNEFIPIRTCKVYHTNIDISHTHVNIIIQFIIHNKRIFAGADLLEMYDVAMETNKVYLDITEKKPILFYSPSSYKDAVEIVSKFRSLHNSKRFSIQTFTIHKADMIPFLTMIKYGKQIVACIIEYSACHSYINAESQYGKIKIASLDTLITLYFSLGLLNRRLFNIGSIECMANKLIEISMKIRNNYGYDKLPFISLKCSGHQTSLPSLIRAKVSRISRKKKNVNRKTYRRKH